MLFKSLRQKLVNIGCEAADRAVFTRRRIDVQANNNCLEETHYK